MRRSWSTRWSKKSSSERQRSPLRVSGLVCAVTAVTVMSQGMADAQVRDLLDNLLGRNRGGRIDSAQPLSESGSAVALRVSFSEVEEPEGVELTARVFDVRLRPLAGFTVRPVAIGASIELRLERGGELVAREVRRLFRVWSSPGGAEASGSDRGEALGEAGGDVSVGSEVVIADREPQELVIDPVPLGDTPTGGSGTPAGGATPGGGATGGRTGGGGRTRETTPTTVRSTRPELITRRVTVPTLGYLWANQPTGSSYAPSAGYSHNSTGGRMVVSRGATGRYGIQFNSLGRAEGPAGGLVVTAYGSGGERCQIQSWNTYSAGLQGSVQCADAAGSPVDSRFTALALFSLGTSRVGYALADRPTASSYSPNERYVSSPGGDGVTVSRSATGSYAVRFPGLFSNSPDRGNVQVSSLGTAGEHCKPTNWTPGAGGALTATVACFSAGGLAADARFAILAVAANQGSEGMAAYTYANQPGTASYTPLPQLTFARGETQITRSGPGAYRVRFGGLGGSRGGTVQVTAVGSGGSWCKVINWDAGADAFSANIRCFGGGSQPMDSMFSVLVVR